MLLRNTTDIIAKLDIPTKVHMIGNGSLSESNQVQPYGLRNPGYQDQAVKEVKV